MAIGTIPSWLELPNFVQAMREGAATGLAARRTDIDESQAADRLQLAYEQLAEKERASNELAAYRQQNAANALELRQAQLESLNAYRQQQLENQAKRMEGGSASIVTHPEVPGMQFLRNPSGSETPVVRPTKEVDQLRLAMQAQNMLPLKSNELPTDPSYQSRTNLAAKVLQAVMPQEGTKKLTKDQARDFLSQAGGDKQKARQMAKDAGFEF